MYLDNFFWQEGRSEKVTNYIFLTIYFYIANFFNSTQYKDNAQEAIYNEIHY